MEAEPDIYRIEPKIKEDAVVHGKILPSHICYQDRVKIAQLIKDSYKEGFLNGMALIRDDLMLPKKETEKQD